MSVVKINAVNKDKVDMNKTDKWIMKVQIFN